MFVFFICIWRAASGTPTIRLPLANRCSAARRPSIPVVALGAALVLVLVVLAAAFHGAIVVWIEAHFLDGLATGSSACFLVAACAGRGGFLEEEGEEFVGDHEVRLLFELLEGGEADEHFEGGEGGEAEGAEGGRVGRDGGARAGC